MSEAQSTTLVTLLLDRSGSMVAVRDATIEAYNAYVAAMKKDQASGEILFSFVQFDTVGLQKVCANRPIGRVPALDHAGFEPRGGTPLIDASVITINAVEALVQARGDAPGVVVCIQTDGQENASSLHDWDELKALIDAKTAAGWQFTFMGAGIDAYEQGRRMGVPVDGTVAYSRDPASTRAAFSETGLNVREFAAKRRSGIAYSMFQKRAAGDRYAGSTQSAAPTEPADESEQDLDLPVFLRRLAAAPQPPQSSAMALDLTHEVREGRMALDLSVEA